MRTSTKSDYQQRINRVLVHIQNNLDDVPNLEELAGIACFSPFHFHRVFRGMVGESLAAHLRRLRLEWAAKGLKGPGLSITDIAFEAGYDSLEAFTRAFKANFGLSPSTYRKKKQYRPTRQDLRARFAKGVEMQVEIKNIDPIRVAFIRHLGPYAQCGETWQRLCDWAGPKGLLAGNSEFMGLCYDDPDVTEGGKIRYDACLSVGAKAQPEGEVGIMEVAGGNYAVTLHKGPFEALHDTYAALCGVWLPENGREAANLPSVEVYLNDPESTPPEELLVEIRMPLK